MKYGNMQPTRRRIALLDPAVATEWSRTNDSGNSWLVRGFALTFHTDATAVSRAPQVQAVAGTDVYFITSTASTQSNNVTAQYSAFPNSSPVGASGDAFVYAWPQDGLWLMPGHVIRSQNTGLQAADQFSKIVLDIVEYPETFPDWLWPLSSAFRMTYSEAPEST